MSSDYLALQVLMMPRDTNGMPMLQKDGYLAPHSSIFGGVILSYLDQAGAIGARHEVVQGGGRQPFLVTAAINRVEFRQGVLVGDVVRFLTRLVRFGRTSITMHVRVEAERDGKVLHVTDAELVYVGVDPAAERRPVPLLPGNAPP